MSNFAPAYGTLLLSTVLAAAGISPAEASLKISGKKTQNVTCSGGVCSATSIDAVLNATKLANMLANGDVAITTESRQG